MTNVEPLTELQQDIFKTITKNDVSALRTLLAQLKESVDFVDENGMTPLQHACYKGNKDAVQLLLDQVIHTFNCFSIERNHLIRPIKYILQLPFKK